jgi:hypothetical protein
LDPTARHSEILVSQVATSKGFDPTIEPKIHISPYGDVSEKCKLQIT